MSRLYFILCLFGLVCVACQPKSTSSVTDDTAGFTIDIQDDTTHITIYSPWQKAEVMQKLAIGNGLLAERVVCTSATHMGFISELGMMDKVVGVCRPNRVYNLSKEDRERITDIGDDMQPSMEKILLLNPDLVILYTYAQGDPIPAQVEALGIPILYCNEWTETTPLARAEWIRFFGMLFGCEAKADSIFADVEKNYNELKQLATQQAKKPKLMCEWKSGSAWYVPGGRSTTGKLYADAGADYAFAHYPNSGAVPLSFETVFDKAQDADIWLMKYNQANDRTMTSMREDYAPYAQFKAYKQKQVYGCNTAYKRYYEDFPFHPDRVLKDLIKIFHPSLLPEYELKYFDKLVE